MHGIADAVHVAYGRMLVRGRIEQIGNSREPNEDVVKWWVGELLTNLEVYDEGTPHAAFACEQRYRLGDLRYAQMGTIIEELTCRSCEGETPAYLALEESHSTRRLITSAHHD